MFPFQLAKGGIERTIYIKLIAPFVHELPASEFEGFGKACTDHKYAYFGTNFLKTKIPFFIPCKVIPLPGISYKDPWAFIISKNSHYKGLINWR